MSNSQVYLPECIICFSCPITPVATPCGHIFCRSCLSTALHVKRHCPICRKKIALKHAINVIATQSVAPTLDSSRDSTSSSPSDRPVTPAGDSKLELLCAKCQNPPRSPELASCGHTFCRPCAHLWYEAELRCPVHNKNLDRRKLYKLFCNGSKSAGKAHDDLHLPMLINSNNNHRALNDMNESFDSSDDSDSSFESDSEIESINDGDFVFINRFFLTIPPIGVRGPNQMMTSLPDLAQPPMAFFHALGRNPFQLMQHTVFPSRLRASELGAGQNNRNPNNGQNAPRRSFFF